MAAAAIDLGDFFSFDIEPRSALTGASTGHRFAVTAYIGARQFTQFGIDVVVASNMTGAPESMQHLSPIPIAGLAIAAYRVYPIVDHIADKHAAMLDTYNDDQPSARLRDLVDLVLIATTQRPRATDLSAALSSEYAHRHLAAPAEVTLPSDADPSRRESQRSSACMYDAYVPNKTISVPEDVVPIIDGLGVPFSTWVADQLRHYAATHSALDFAQQLLADAELADAKPPTVAESSAALTRMARSAPW